MVAILLASVTGSKLHAAAIPGLFNTGLGTNGVILANNAVDPHYTLVVSADTNFPGPEVRTLLPGFPVPPWVAEGPDSRWIAPRGNQGTGNAPGDYTYRTTFNLTGFDPAKAKIIGKWSTDNAGSDILINGESLGFLNTAQFGGFTDFTIESGFVAGTNTIDFIVNNAEPGVNPTGLRVELRGTVELPSEAPTIVTQPANAIGLIGDAASFTVTAEGTPPLSYQWRLNGTNVAGANETTYTLSSLTLAQAGNYTIVISNSFGSRTSIVATLRVLEPLTNLFNTGVADDRTLLDDLGVDPHYKFSLNPDNPANADAMVEDTSVFPIVAGPWLANTESAKWIGPRGETSAAAGGDYRYRLVLALGDYDPTTVRLTGNWAVDNLGIDILVNGASSGVRNNSGFGGTVPFVVTNGFISGTNTIDFVVRNEGAGYTGLFIDNLRGGANKKTGPALQPPRLVAQPTDTVAFTGETVTLTVVADGSAPLSYQWQLNGQPLAAGGTSNSLVLSNLTVSQGGQYRAVVSNSVGTTNTAPVTLTVLEDVGGLFNTGVGPDRQVLADGEIDPHYQLVTNAHDAASHDAFVEDSTVFPIVAGPWVPNTATSKWIGPGFDPNGAAGDYAYRTTLVLTGVNPATVRVQGDWATDNIGPDIVVNGVSTGVRNDAQFTVLSHFVITSGWQNGTNVIDFVVNNAGTDANPAGFKVDNVRVGAIRGGGGAGPSLTATLSGSELTLSWPASASDYALFSTASLSSPNWTAVTESTTTTGGNKTVKVQVTAGSRFFRLQR